MFCFPTPALSMTEICRSLPGQTNIVKKERKYQAATHSATPHKAEERQD